MAAISRNVCVRANTDQSLKGLLAVNLHDFLQEVIGHRTQGLIRPLREPINGTAGHQTGELPQTGTEHFTDGAVKEEMCIMYCTYVRTYTWCGCSSQLSTFTL